MVETIQLIVTVKAYPAASMKYGEAVCVAGIRSDSDRPEWVRLFPVEFRDLPIDQQFAKWSEIQLSVSRSSDSRPESLRPDSASIRVIRKLDTSNGWASRRPFVESLLVESMCEARRQQVETGASLAAFRPHEVRDVIVEADLEWTPQQLASLGQLSLFAPDKTKLQKVPWRWKYSYWCGGKCNGHSQTIIDWEVFQAWRSWRWEHGSEGAAEMVRGKWLNELCSPKKDTVFFVGNQHQRPDGFLVLGVYWPPKSGGPLQDVKNVDLWS
jgi:hypothetical protein